MLEMRPNCECCDKDLPPESDQAIICSFECTFCLSCTQSVLKYTCPNCGGNMVSRPKRHKAALLQHPASTKRILKANGCSD